MGVNIKCCSYNDCTRRGQRRVKGATEGGRQRAVLEKRRKEWVKGASNKAAPGKQGKLKQFPKIRCDA